MKNIAIVFLCSIAILGLGGCHKSSSQSDNDAHKSAVVKKNTDTKKKKANKKPKESKKEQDSPKDTENTNNDNQSTNEVAQQQNTQEATNNQSQSVPASSNTYNNGISYDTNTLTGYLNTYGITPAHHKRLNGMGALESLQSTPDTMKTSGELQTQHGIEQGYLDQNGNTISSDYNQ